MKAARSLMTAALTAAALLAPAPAALAADKITDGVDLEVVASGLSLAVDLASPPGDDRLFVVEKAGRIRIVANGALLGTPFLDISGPVRSSGNEQGLLGLAFPDDYAETGLFYVHYTSDAGSGDTAVAEYSVGTNPNRADPGSGRVLFTTNQTHTNHNGGSLQVGPDGFLYVGLGDGGGGGDPGENGQNKNTVLGSILRLDPATGDAAPGNPFIGVAGADEIWAWGLRNPWRFAFDAATGDMWIGDVGQGAREEIDVAPAGVGGLNFGWNTYEGNRCFDSPCSPAGKVFPIHEYSHRSGGACGGSITGGYVYRGNDLPWLRGHYFYGDWCHGDLSSFRVQGGQAVDHIDWTETLPVPGFITSFGVDGRGELYFLAQGNVYKFVSERNPDCDFNGDGRADIAVGVPGEDLAGVIDAGAVKEFHGRAGPLDPADDATWRQGTGGVPGTPNDGDAFGEALACGDFDGDSFGDLAIGVTGEAGGSVQVLYGSGSGLTSSGADTWTHEGLGVGTTDPGDLFGHALAVSDFNRDGYDDLAIGAPGDDEAGPDASGSITAIFGSGSGLVAAGATLIHQNTQFIVGVAAAGERFGYDLAGGDVDGDGYGDVAVGIPGDVVGGVAGAGSVAVIFGKPLGLGPRDVLVNRASPGIKGSPAADSRWGIAVAIGNFDLGGFDDLAVGIERASDAGAVQVIYGDVAGPGSRDAVYRQGAPNLPGTSEQGDLFGYALAAGDADGDGYDELAIGAPNETHSGQSAAGMVGVLPGGSDGLVRSGYQRFHQNIAGVKGVAAAADNFGWALRFVDTRGDGRADLVIGVPQQSAGGEVALLPGKAAGLSTIGDQLWSQDTEGVSGASEPHDHFGGAL